MEEFLKLNWGVKEPHELDYGVEFIPEEEIAQSYVFRGLPDSDNSETDEKKACQSDDKLRLVPGQQYTYKIQTKSFLNAAEHAKCLTALKLIQANKKAVGFYERGCMELYNNSHQRILAENTKFLKFAKGQFDNQKNKLFKLKPYFRKFSKSLWYYGLERVSDYKRYYKGIDMLPYSYKDDEEPIEMVHVENLLELGSLAKFSGPTLLKPYFLNKKRIPKRKILYNSNQAVSKDVNIDKLVETNQIDVVISSSGLTKLLNFTNTDLFWDIPIVVKEVVVTNRDGTKHPKNVVFIDKPFPNKSPTVFDLNQKCIKTLLKSNFCDVEAFSFGNLETSLGEYRIDQEAAQAPKINNNVKGDHNTRSKTKRKINDDKLDDNVKKIKIDESSQLDSIATEDKIESDGIDPQEIKFHQNVTYRLWKLQLKTEQCKLIKDKFKINNIHILVRCKLDGCESGENGQLQPVNVIPKIEYHLDYGAGIPTRQELIKQWVHAHFRPCSQVRRIRTHYFTGEIISIDNCTPQKIALEAHAQYELNPHLGLGVLYKIFSRLVNLNGGNYILRHLPKDGAFVTLLKETNESDDAIFDLYDQYDVKKCKVNTDITRKWHSIDVNYILPRQIALQQMPGMFKPREIIKYDKNKKRKPRKKKNKKKNKLINKGDK